MMTKDQGDPATTTTNATAMTDSVTITATTMTTQADLNQFSLEFDPFTKERVLSYSLVWIYGDKPRDDCIEVTKMNKNVVKLRRWTTFKSFHFPNGAIVTGFRGRRDYKDGNCQGMMCCKWCPEQKNFPSIIFTISNGYNGAFSEKDFETIEIVDENEFRNVNPNAIKNIKHELK